MRNRQNMQFLVQFVAVCIDLLKIQGF